MRIFVNRKAVRGPWGGENSFMGALCRWLTAQGHTIVVDREASVDVALLNALTQIDVAFVQHLRERGVPIIHRKTGFVVSGSQEMRTVHNGVVEGDRLQIEMSRYAAHSIFQSHYSHEFFTEEGFNGPYSIINNGVDERKFNLYSPGFFSFGRKKRDYWKGQSPFRVLAVSWSSDPAKGFADYQEIDRMVADRSDLDLTFVGNRPEGLTFDNIRMLPAQPHKKLAQLYRTHHALLFLGRQETCSNTILEGINCGLPVIYHPSGASPEIAGPYGAAYHGDFGASVDYIRDNYDDLIARIEANPFQISRVAPQYLAILEAVASCGAYPPAVGPQGETCNPAVTSGMGGR